MQTFPQLGILHHNLNIPFLPRRFYFNQYYVFLSKKELIVHTLKYWLSDVNNSGKSGQTIGIIS